MCIGVQKDSQETGNSLVALLQAIVNNRAKRALGFTPASGLYSFRGVGAGAFKRRTIASQRVRLFAPLNPFSICSEPAAGIRIGATPSSELHNKYTAIFEYANNL